MVKNIIQIPRKELLEGKEFHADYLDQALENCQKEGFEAVFMPQLIDARIEAPKDARIWQTWYSAPSIRATGRTKQGIPVVVYAHIPNYFSDPENIEEAMEQGLINGAGILPQKEFQKLLDLEDDKNVFLVDYNELKSSKSTIISSKGALEHPQTIPFIGGRERAEAYLGRHKEVYGNSIGMRHSDDLHDKPTGRLLFLGYDCDDDLNGSYDLHYLEGRFVGVRAKGAAQKDIEKIR